MKRTRFRQAAASLLVASVVVLTLPFAAGSASASTSAAAYGPIVTKAAAALKKDHIWVDPAAGTGSRYTITPAQKTQLEQMITDPKAPRHDVFIAVVPPGVINEAGNPEAVSSTVSQATGLPGVYGIWTASKTTSYLFGPGSFSKPSFVSGDAFDSLKNFVTKVESSPITGSTATNGNHSTTTTTTTVVRKSDHTVLYWFVGVLAGLIVIGLLVWAFLGASKRREKRQAFEGRKRRLTNDYNATSTAALNESPGSDAFNLYISIGTALKNAKTEAELDGVEKDLGRLNRMLHPSTPVSTASSSQSTAANSADTAAGRHRAAAPTTTQSGKPLPPEGSGNRFRPSSTPQMVQRPANPGMYPPGYAQYNVPGYGPTWGYMGPDGFFYQLLLADMIFHNGMFYPPYGYWGPDAFYGYPGYDGYDVVDYNYPGGDYVDGSYAGDDGGGYTETTTTTTVTDGGDGDNVASDAGDSNVATDAGDSNVATDAGNTNVATDDPNAATSDWGDDDGSGVATDAGTGPGTDPNSNQDGSDWGASGDTSDQRYSQSDNSGDYGSGDQGGSWGGADYSGGDYSQPDTSSGDWGGGGDFGGSDFGGGGDF